MRRRKWWQVALVVVGVVTTVLTGVVARSVVATVGPSPMERAEQGGFSGARSEIAELVSEFPNVNEHDGQIPLTWAAGGRAVVAVEELLAAGADPDYQTRYAHGPLADIAAQRDQDWNGMAASESDATGAQYRKIIRLLLDHGADPCLRILQFANDRWPAGPTAYELALRPNGTWARSLIDAMPEAEQFRTCPAN